MCVNGSDITPGWRGAGAFPAAVAATSVFREVGVKPLCGVLASGICLVWSAAQAGADGGEVSRKEAECSRVLAFPGWSARFAF